jgi:hypothetical protein
VLSPYIEFSLSDKTQMCRPGRKGPIPTHLCWLSHPPAAAARSKNINCSQRKTISSLRTWQNATPLTAARAATPFFPPWRRQSVRRFFLIKVHDGRAEAFLLDASAQTQRPPQHSLCPCATRTNFDAACAFGRRIGTRAQWSSC